MCLLVDYFFSFCVLFSNHKVMESINWSRADMPAAAAREKPMVLDLLDNLIGDKGE